MPRPRRKGLNFIAEAVYRARERRVPWKTLTARYGLGRTRLTQLRAEAAEKKRANPENCS